MSATTISMTVDISTIDALLVAAQQFNLGILIITERRCGCGAKSSTTQPLAQDRRAPAQVLHEAITPARCYGCRPGAMAVVSTCFEINSHPEWGRLLISGSEVAGVIQIPV